MALATFRFRSTRNIRKPGDVGNLTFVHLLNFATV